MNIYDFDNTIYDGDSSVDFFLFSLKKHKKNFLKLPNILWHSILYVLKIDDKETFKSTFFSIVTNSINIEKDVEEFWNNSIQKLKPFYMKVKRKDDIIISASPSFLLKPICQRLNVELIATDINMETGELMSRNCYGKEKVNRLVALNIYQCDKFFSDSLSDKPLANMAKQAFLVKKNNIFTWEKE